LTAVLWKHVRVFRGSQELGEAERAEAAQHLKHVRSFSTLAVSMVKTPEKSEEIRKQLEVSFDCVKSLRFRDRQSPDSAPDLHWQDVVFTLRRSLGKDDFVRMNLPAEFWNKYDVPESIKEPLRKYIDQFESFYRDGVGLYLYGGVGVGKTSAAIAVAQVVRSLAHPVLFVTVSDLREMTRNRIDFDEGLTFLDRCKRVDFLVLDNVREEDAKEMYIGALALEDLIRHRAAAKRPTVVTSRMCFNELDNALPGFGTIAHASCVFLEVTGRNRRSTKQAELKTRLNSVVKKGM